MAIVGERMNPDQKVLILSFSPIARDPRVMRQVQLLESRVKLSVAGYGPPPAAKTEFICLDYKSVRKVVRRLRWETQLALGLFERYYWSRPEVDVGVKKLAGRNFDLVIVNDIYALPLGIRIAREAPVLLDAHEYSPTEFEDRLLWQLRYGRHYQYMCHQYLSRIAAMTTVCAGVSDEYHRNFGVAATIIENAPSHQELSPSPVEAGRVRMIHHGAAIRSRRLELMIDVLERTDERFTLDFMLVAEDTRYLRELRDRATRVKRIRFLPPVPMASICQQTNRYDVGLFLLPPVNLNYRFALPNKLFEFIQARLAVAIGPSPEMALVVREHDLGIVADSFAPAALASSLNRMTEQELIRYKHAANNAAKALCFEAISDRLLALIERLLHRTSHVRAA